MNKLSKILLFVITIVGAFLGINKVDARTYEGQIKQDLMLEVHFMLCIHEEKAKCGLKDNLLLIFYIKIIIDPRINLQYP